MSSSDACAPVWRWGRGFEAEELQRRLRGLEQCPSSGPSSDEEAARDPSWNHYYSEAVIAQERPGPPEPGGAFQQARQLVSSYAFSDPGIVQGYFDARRALSGRPMLLELKVLGLHFLCGVVVRATRDEQLTGRSVFGFRYDTLEGHLESGAEWFLLSKDHESGAVQFRIQAAWREGNLPNWWTRLGFHALARPYQRAWHRLAYVRLRNFMKARDLPPLPHARVIMQQWRPPLAAPSTESGAILEHES